MLGFGSEAGGEYNIFSIFVFCFCAAANCSFMAGT